MKCPVCKQEMKGINHAQDERRLRDFTRELSLKYSRMMIDILEDIKTTIDENIDETKEEIKYITEEKK